MGGWKPEGGLGARGRGRRASPPRTRLGACDACFALRVIERYRDELTDMAAEARLVQ
jgi:hypothetical protein